MSDESAMIPRKERVRLYPAEGVVLRRLNLGEADRILTLFTDRHGKLKVVAKGVRRTQSRLAGHLEPFARTNVLLAKGRNLDIVTQANLIDPFVSVHQNELLIAYAGYFADLLDAFSGEGQENRPAYELLITSLARLDSGCDPFVTSTFFEYRLLTIMGFQPELFKCINCGAELAPVENGFSLAGGVVCPNCLPFDPRTTPLSVNALKYLRLIERGEFAMALRLRVPDALRREIDRALRGYVSSVLEREPRSLAVLRTIAN